MQVMSNMGSTKEMRKIHQKLPGSSWFLDWVDRKFPSVESILRRTNRLHVQSYSLSTKNWRRFVTGKRNSCGPRHTYTSHSKQHKVMVSSLLTTASTLFDISPGRPLEAPYCFGRTKGPWRTQSDGTWRYKASTFFRKLWIQSFQPRLSSANRSLPVWVGLKRYWSSCSWTGEGKFLSPCVQNLPESKQGLLGKQTIRSDEWLNWMRFTFTWTFFLKTLIELSAPLESCCHLCQSLVLLRGVRTSIVNCVIQISSLWTPALSAYHSSFAQ